MTKAIVLLSGGQDSTTCLYWAKQNHEIVALSFNYGQRHAAELDAAKKIAADAGVKHVNLTLGVLADIGDSALIGHTKEIKSEGGLVDREMPQGLPTSFVPGRNILLLTAAAAYAVKVRAKVIVGGMCQTDYSGYPDCRRDTIDALEKTFALGLGVAVEICTPLMYLTKKETVEMARSLPGCWDALADSITCYEGKHPGCGTCPACELREKGFKEAGHVDPSLATSSA